MVLAGLDKAAMFLSLAFNFDRLAIFNELKFVTDTFYEEKDAIGKRYRRQDAIGTPFCITIDHDSLKDNMVTIRDRDTMEQRRVLISELSSNDPTTCNPGNDGTITIDGLTNGIVYAIDTNGTIFNTITAAAPIIHGK